MHYEIAASYMSIAAAYMVRLLAIGDAHAGVCCTMEHCCHFCHYVDLRNYRSVL